MISSKSDHTTGLFQGTLAFVIWGVFGLYFTLLAEVPSDEVLMHRILWCIVFVGILVLFQGKLYSTFALLKQRKLVAWLALSSLLITGNWWLYIWAVGQGRVLDASLGYFLSPLFSVLLGWLVFKETLNPWQKMALALAAIGVGWQIIALGLIPWIAIGLASLFAVYGVIRKQVPVDSISGLLIETSIVLPIALVYLTYLTQQGNTHFNDYTWELIGAGLMTAVPLIFFASAARKIPLSTLGFLNYIGPIIQFLSALFILNETFGVDRFISFAFIWSGLVVFSIDLYQKSKQHRIPQ